MIPRRSTRHNLRFSSLEGTLAMPWLMMTMPGSFLMAALLNGFFDVGPFWFGLLCSLPALANALHIVLLPVLGRTMTVREVTLGQGWLNFGLWMGGLLAIAYLPVDAPTRGIFFTVLFAVNCMSFSLISVGWTAWMGDFVPSRIRGRYMAVRNRTTSFGTLLFMLFCMLLLQMMGETRTTYLILMSAAMILRSVSLICLHDIHGPDPSGGDIPSKGFLQDLKALSKQKTLIRFIVFGSVMGFCMAFMGAVAPVYAFRHLGASSTQFTLFNILSTLTAMVLVKVWGRVVDHHGAVPVLILAMLAWRLGDIGWLFITQDTVLWLGVVWLWGGATAMGVMLAAFNLLLKLIPPKLRAPGVSLNLTLTSIAATFGSLLGGTLIAQGEQLNLNMAVVYRALLGGAILIQLVALFLLKGMKEPDIQIYRNTIHGAMRTLRILTVSEGLGFLSEMRFIVKSPKKRRQEKAAASSSRRD